MLFTNHGKKDLKKKTLPKVSKLFLIIHEKSLATAN